MQRRRKARDKTEEFLSQIIARLNDVFESDGLTENDLLDYARTITNKVSENESVMHQIRNNSPEQALLGDFASAVDNAVMESADAHHNQMNQVLSNKNVAADFGRIVFDLLVAQMKAGEVGPGPPGSQRPRSEGRAMAPERLDYIVGIPSAGQPERESHPAPPDLGPLPKC